MGEISEKIKAYMKYWKLYTVVLTPVIFSVIFAFSTSKETRCGFVILVMAIYWMSEALPLAVTALMPVFAFPLLGVLPSSTVCLVYMTETNMMFLGGLMVAIAVEHCNLHKRIALFVILHVGQSPRRLMAGFMLTTMFLSMWISNTATTAMMVPIVNAILDELFRASEMEKKFALIEIKPGNSKDLQRPANEPECNGAESRRQGGHVNYGFEKNEKSSGKQRSDAENVPDEGNPLAEVPATPDSKAVKNMYFLAVAYAANIGGTGSLTGTGPNLVVKEVLDSSFKDPSGLNFASWMAFNVPGMLLCTFIGWFWLQVLFIGFRQDKSVLKQSTGINNRIEAVLREQYKNLGSFSFHERAVLSVFVTLVLLWFFREPGFMPGWSDLFMHMFGEEFKIGDGTPALLCAFILFVIPMTANFWPSPKNPGGPSPGCLNWSIIHEKVPWGIVLLLGGGFAMAKATNDSGLSVYLGGRLRELKRFPSSLSVLLMSTATAMATEIASNTATASIIMPILRDVSLGICVNPLYFMLPAAVCCSYAFMIPVATPPNAIVYGAAGMKTIDMIKAGFVMNIICVLVINILINTIGSSMFDLGTMPLWTNTTTGNLIPDCLANVTEVLMN